MKKKIEHTEKPKIVSKKIVKISNVSGEEKKGELKNNSSSDIGNLQNQNLKNEINIDANIVKAVNFDQKNSTLNLHEISNDKSVADSSFPPKEIKSDDVNKPSGPKPGVGEEKRKAAEILANIHSEIYQSNVKNNDGLNSLSNPFLPLFSDAPVASKGKAKIKRRSRPERERTPLEKVDLSQLKLVATLRAKSGNKALVEDSTGKGYVVNKGTYIGINFGSVVEITDQSVVVEEEIETISGDVKIQKREIKLQKAPGE